MGTVNKGRKLWAWLFIILLIPFLSIWGIKSRLPEGVYQAWQVASVSCMLLLVFLVAKKIKVNWAIFLFGLYQAVVLISTTLNHGFSPGIFTVTVGVICVFMLLQSPFYFDILSAFCRIVVVSAIVNFLTMLPNLQDEYAQYFIGGKNSLGMFLIPGVFLLLIKSKDYSDKLTRVDTYVVGLCLFSVFLGGSTTGIVVVLFAIGLLVLSKAITPQKRTYLLVILFFYALLLLLADYFLPSRLWITFTSFFDKSNTLTSRTTIWTIVKEIIRENWLFGSGRGTQIAHITSWGTSSIMTEAHNFILEILMEGGIVALVLYTSLFYKAVKHLDMKDERNRLVFISLCVLLINGLTESTLNNIFVSILLGIACRYAAENQGNKKYYEQQT